MANRNPRLFRVVVCLLCELVLALFHPYGHFADHLVAQEFDSFALARGLLHYQRGYYWFDGYGRLRTSLRNSIANTNGKFFEDVTIQKEIELVEHQRAEYNSVIANWHKSFDDTINDIISPKAHIRWVPQMRSSN